MASKREQVFALFFVAWTQCPLRESFPWASEGPIPLKETINFKKGNFLTNSSGNTTRGPLIIFLRTAQKERKLEQGAIWDRRAWVEHRPVHPADQGKAHKLRWGGGGGGQETSYTASSAEKKKNFKSGLEKSGRIVAFCDWNARFCNQKTWCSRNFAPKTRRPGASLRPDEHSSRPDSENKN